MTQSSDVQLLGQTLGSVLGTPHRTRQPASCPREELFSECGQKTGAARARFRITLLSMQLCRKKLVVLYLGMQIRTNVQRNIIFNHSVSTPDVVLDNRATLDILT